MRQSDTTHVSSPLMRHSPTQLSAKLTQRDTDWQYDVGGGEGNDRKIAEIRKDERDKVMGGGGGGGSMKLTLNIRYVLTTDFRQIPS